jgi:hypothetical protein
MLPENMQIKIHDEDTKPIYEQAKVEPDKSIKMDEVKEGIPSSNLQQNT